MKRAKNVNKSDNNKNLVCYIYGSQTLKAQLTDCINRQRANCNQCEIIKKIACLHEK